MSTTEPTEEQQEAFGLGRQDAILKALTAMLAPSQYCLVVRSTTPQGEEMRGWMTNMPYAEMLTLLQRFLAAAHAGEAPPAGMKLN